MRWNWAARARRSRPVDDATVAVAGRRFAHGYQTITSMPASSTPAAAGTELMATER